MGLALSFGGCEGGSLGLTARNDGSVGVDAGTRLDMSVADGGPAIDSGLDFDMGAGVDLGTVDLGTVDLGTDMGSMPVITCATANYPAGTSLRRRPYQQSVTTNAAHIVWTTAAMGSPTIRIAPTTTGVWSTVTPGSGAYSTSTTGASAAYVQHDASLTGLSADTSYCYEILDGTTVLANGISFHTSWTGTPHPLRVLAFGDSGTGGTAQLALRDRMTNYEFDIFVHLGDIAYGSGTYTELESHFFTVYRDILDDVPFWPSIGNHEYVTNEGDPYINVYVLPRQALDPVHHERYYSFDYGNAHFVSLDSNPEMFDAIGSGSGTDDELDWLAADLAASTADWKIVFFHHPAYSSGEHGNEADVDAQFVPIFQEHGVDLVLNGHDHDYERTVPIWDDAAAPTDPHAITYVVAGGGGGEPRVVSSSWFTAFATDEGNHFLSITIDGCMLRAEAINTDADVIDSFNLNGCD